MPDNNYLNNLKSAVLSGPFSIISLKVFVLFIEQLTINKIINPFNLELLNELLILIIVLINLTSKQQ